MDIICNNRLPVQRNGVWKMRKETNLRPSSPQNNPSEWENVDFEKSQEMAEAHENDAFILCWVDALGRSKDKDFVWAENGRLKVKKSATIDDVLAVLNAVVYFSEGAKVESPNLCSNFTSDRCLYYQDTDGVIFIGNAPHELKGTLPKPVIAKLLSLLGLPAHWKSPFRFITETKK